MKLNKKIAILDDKGQELKDPNGVCLTIENVCVSALYDTKSNPSQGQDAYTRGKLAHAMLSQDEIDLSSEEVTLLKQLVGNTWGPAVVFQVWNILDPK